MSFRVQSEGDLLKVFYILNLSKEEFKRLLGRSEDRADAALHNDFVFHKIRYRN